ncbi:hypothetical protein BpHYR1_029503 [Brachionus plicatilis]|uniref:Uncharacterized protein n=1 Tax=Brachionus plicatilis TaxID=10195 RepID=A0A3M7RPW0_BRAPC|nr:hypothetical protein BpHYR1_029503 [Brachionus plicatilis]
MFNLSWKEVDLQTEYKNTKNQLKIVVVVVSAVYNAALCQLVVLVMATYFLSSSISASVDRSPPSLRGNIDEAITTGNWVIRNGNTLIKKKDKSNSSLMNLDYINSIYSKLELDNSLKIIQKNQKLEDQQKLNNVEEYLGNNQKKKLF